MAVSQRPAGEMTGATAWVGSLRTPARLFLRTESGSAVVLLLAAVAALIWTNVSSASYESVWHTEFSVHIGNSSISQDLRGWVNGGLMTFFFFVVGLEARREFDMGELRERRRVILPVLAGVGGMLVPIGLYLAVNAGRSSEGAWGIAMSTDTAFALGLLAIVGRRVPDRVRTFLLTVLVVDDVASLLVIASAYSSSVKLRPLAFAAGFFVLIIGMRARRIRYGPGYAVLGLAAWVSMFFSGIDPVVVGLAMGLLTFAYAPSRDALERATGLFRLFREQPTPELARSATAGLAAAMSQNERLQQLFHPWTSFVIVPVFALANAGIPLSASFLSDAFSSPITLGILLGYVVGKPVGILATSYLAKRLGRGSIELPVGWASIAGAGTIAGIGFTVSLLIATLAFGGPHLQEAKVGVLSTAIVASLVTWTVFRVTALLPAPTRARALLGTAGAIVDLAAPVDPDRDHIRGPAKAPVTVVEYGDFECPYCGQAEPSVRELLAGHGDVRYVWRHLPLVDVHPHAQLAAEAAEAAAAQGRFWEMHDLLLDRQEHLLMTDLARYADELGLDVDRFRNDLRRHAAAERIAEDTDSAGISGVSGTPTFFVNGSRHYGAYDIDALTEAVKLAKTRFVVQQRARADG